jgi:unsaturated chondroitin disaccharide hydrolase
MAITINDEGRKVDAFKKETPDLTELFEAGFKEAMKQADENLADFTHDFPASATVDNVYELNTQTSQPGDPEWPIPGDNVGWTSSFWTGILWLGYERTKDEKFLEAIKIQVDSFNNRIAEKKDVDTHDLGFLYSLSSVADYKLTGNEESKKAGIAAADHLATRYIDSAGIVQAWGALDNPAEQGRMIIDCLMNLPLLHWASEVTGDNHYAEKAKSHAKQALKYIVREDGTTFHTYFFDVETGEAKFGRTAQGASDDSCWSRGQAWGIYGFTLSYLYSDDEEYLETAKTLANYFLNRSPEDFVVYWDLIYKEADGEEKDASSSAIAVCGLLELVKHLTNDEEIRYYKNAAHKILESLVENYSGPRNDSKSNALLLEGVYSKPGNFGVNEGNLWGDYFYVEALTRVLNPDWELYW